MPTTAAALAGLYALHRLGRRSGLAPGEATGALPGDELVAQPGWQSTRAITIDAPPERVWPWIVQMGFPGLRAGWYTPHWLDQLTFGIEERSANRIVPELQQLEPGDRVPDSVDWSAYFTVVRVDPPHALVLHSTRHVIRPIRTIDFSWAFVVRELGHGRSRLLVRARADYTPRRALPFVELIVGPADFVNAGAMLRGIKQRAESAGEIPKGGAMTTSELADEEFVSITTFRRDGTPVSTPVWVAGEHGNLLVISEADTWKVKRIQRDGHVRVAPCGARGAVKGEPVDAEATIESDTTLVDQLLARKYGWKYRAYMRFSALVRKLRGQATPTGVTIRITPS